MTDDRRAGIRELQEIADYLEAQSWSAIVPEYGRNVREAAAALEQAERELRISRHELALIESHTERGITDASTPLHIRVQNIVEQLEAAEAQLAALSREREGLEREVREMLWLGHGHHGLYGDDGEMQCSLCRPHWDYKRAPLDELRQQVMLLNAERAKDVLAALSPTPAPQPEHDEHCEAEQPALPVTGYTACGCAARRGEE